MGDIGPLLLIFFLCAIAMVALTRPASDADLKALAKLDKRLREDIERSKRDN